MRPPRPYSANVQAAVSDHDLYAPYTNNLQPYVSLFKALPNIAEAMQYASLPEHFRQGVWEAIDAAEPSGSPDIGRPAAYVADIFNNDIPQEDLLYLTRAEAVLSYGNRVAHSLYHEVHKTFPWSLSKYSSEELYWIFNLPGRFDAPAFDDDGQVYRFADYCDYSAGKAYQALLSVGIQPNESQMTFAIIDWLFNNGFHHDDSTEADHCADIEHVQVDWVSRAGCHTSSRIQHSLLCAANIPFRFMNAQDALHNGSWFGGTHNTSVYLVSDLVMLHSDDIYSGGFRDIGDNTSAKTILAPIAAWDSIESQTTTLAKSEASTTAYLNKSATFPFRPIIDLFMGTRGLLGRVNSLTGTSKDDIETLRLYYQKISRRSGFDL